MQKMGISALTSEKAKNEVVKNFLTLKDAVKHSSSPYKNKLASKAKPSAVQKAKRRPDRIKICMVVEDKLRRKMKRKVEVVIYVRTEHFKNINIFLVV